VALPDSCSIARAVAKAEELNLCNASRSEATYLANAHNEAGIEDRSLIYDSKGLLAMNAPTLAWACSQAALTGIARDEPLQTPLRKHKWMHFSCISNSLGCALNDAAVQNYDAYLHRSQDAGAQLKLLATLLWLRDRADDKRPLAERLVARPDELKSPTRDIEIIADGKALSIRMFDERRGSNFELPLPAYLQ
jgi:hypothetical protein